MLLCLYKLVGNERECSWKENKKGGVEVQQETQRTQHSMDGEHTYQLIVRDEYIYLI